jgi:hypothetical protein
MVVILSEAKNLIDSGTYSFEILRLSPQNDVTGSLAGGISLVDRLNRPNRLSRRPEILGNPKYIKKLLTYIFYCRRISLNLKLNVIFFTLSRINLNLNLTHRFHQTAPRNCKDGRATGQPQGVGSESYLNSTSQGSTPKDERKDGHICSRRAGDS